MAVATFAVVHGDVQAHYFPQLAAFGAATDPTSTAVGQMISAEAAVLAGRLAAQSVSASVLSADAGATYSNAYAWCQDTIRLGAALRVSWAMAGGNPSAEAWEKELEQRYADLAKHGYVILGDAPEPSEEPNGPRWHVGNHSLDTGEDDDISDAIPRFRRDDEL